jgi:hypothetical protein
LILQRESVKDEETKHWCAPSMIVQALEKFLHQVRATILPAIIRDIVEYAKVFLVDTLVCIGSEMDINSRTSTPFINTALNLIICFSNQSEPPESPIPLTAVKINIRATQGNGRNHLLNCTPMSRRFLKKQTLMAA